MVIVRTKGTGGFDKATKTWRLRGKGYSVTIGRLQEVYGLKFTATDPAKLEKETAPYWRRWLQEREEVVGEAKKTEEKAIRFAPTLARLEEMLSRLEAQSPGNAVVERLRGSTVANLEGHDFGHVGSVESFALPTVKEAPQITIATEAQAFLEDLVKKGKSAAYYQNRQALELLNTVCGHEEPGCVSVDHFRVFMQKVTTREGWGVRAHHNIVRYAKVFLKTVAQERGISYGFLASKKFVIVVGEGRKIKYTEAQVKIALDNATGLQRVQLLLGLNCGMYKGDLLQLTATQIKDGYLTWQRAKLGKNAPVLRHKLWKATLEALRSYDFKGTENALHEGYHAFAKAHGLPPHIALRKTTAQLLQDRDGGHVSRMFRGEIAGGTHTAYYVEKRLGDKEQGQLDVALDALGNYLNCQ